LSVLQDLEYVMEKAGEDADRGDNDRGESDRKNGKEIK
jgi:hypothetical protein